MALELLPQCCDAGNYLDLGRACALDGTCWHTFRPGGTLYWFSIPYRMGWPLSSIVWMNLGIILLSCLLAPLALFRSWAACSSLQRAAVYGGLLLAAVLVHGFFFYPVLFYSLADLPGTALVLLGLWLFLLGRRWRSLLLVLLAGLCLGAGIWVRAFYLYPVLLAVGLVLLASLIGWRYNWRNLALLACLLPVALQYQATHEATGQWGFLDPQSTSFWTGGHLSSNFSAYDTVLPRSFHYSIPSCAGGQGLQQLLEQRNVAGVACLFAARTAFYLGSYASKTYLFSKHERTYFLTFLLLNLAAIVLALCWLWQLRREDGSSALLVVLVAALCYGEALVLLPEQRFVIAVQVLAWLLAAAWLAGRLARRPLPSGGVAA